jgi:protein-tyrosine-phosphatase
METTMKVISGGQNGVDQAAIRAAKECGLETGGWIPKGCRTLDGPRPDLILEYNMQEHNSFLYPPRTEANVKDSCGTIRFAKTFSSAGERCTLRCIKWHKRPYLDVHLNNPIDKEEVLSWIKKHDIKVLNIAGNSEETAPGIGDFVFEYLKDVFCMLNKG